LLIYYYRVEAAHRFLKRYIASSQGDLLVTWIAIEHAIANATRKLIYTASQVQASTPIDVDRRIFSACFGIVTPGAFRAIQDHLEIVEKPYKPCTSLFTRTTGLPCAHTVNDRKELGLGLVPTDFHEHWYWDRHRVALRPPILDPLQVISRGRPRTKTDTSKVTKIATARPTGRGTRSIKRIPSGFEATEPRQWKCGLCKLPGHNRSSLRCLVNLRQDQEEQLGVIQTPSDQELQGSPTESAPAEIEGPTIVVEGPTDTRPIWPGRIEVIYAKYIAEKTVWLTSHPHIQASKYRSARGLTIYTPKDRRYHALSRTSVLRYTERIDLTTEKVVAGKPNWSDEELDAYIDYQLNAEADLEKGLLEEFVAAGCLNTHRPNDIHQRIERDIDDESARYQFYTV
jgi:hypothetical protein